MSTGFIRYSQFRILRQQTLEMPMIFERKTKFSRFAARRWHSGIAQPIFDLTLCIETNRYAQTILSIPASAHLGLK